MDPRNNNSFGAGGRPISGPITSDGQNSGAAPVVTGQPMGVPMAGGGMGTPITSGGDVVISSGGGGNKGKKWLVVLAVILFIVAVGCGVAWWFLREQGGNTGTGSNGGGAAVVENVAAKTAFNEYANYLILGKGDSSADIDLDKVLERYDIYSPTDVFAETASFVELKKINEKYEILQKVAGWDSDGVVQKYFYYYLGCQKGEITAAVCKEKLGDDYTRLFAPYANKNVETEAILKAVEMRRAAMQAVFDEYYKVYGINTEGIENA